MDEPTPSKACTRCGVTKPLGEFHRDKSASDGYTGTCKPCKRAARYERLARTDTSILKSCRECGWTAPLSAFPLGAAKCPPCLSAYQQEYRSRPEVAQARADYAAVYRVANYERIREREREYYRANRDLLRAKRQAYWASLSDERRERHLALVRAWQRERPEYMAAHYKAKRARRRGALVDKVDLEALWTGICALCEEHLDPEVPYPEPASKSIDHIIPLIKGGTHTQDNLQWAHLGCNMRKGARLPE